MGMLSKGTGKDLASVARRLERVEMFLAGFQREKIISQVLGRGDMLLDVLAIPSGKRNPDGTLIFWPTLIKKGTDDAPTFAVMLSDGWVNERIPGVNDPVTNATAVHKPHNIEWGSDGPSQVPPKLTTDQREFPIKVGDQISVVVYVSAEGAVELPDDSEEEGPTKVTVEEEDFKSIHYVPPRPIDEDKGVAGEYHYKIAVLRAEDATHSGPWLEMFLAGSHIDHFRDLPIHDNCAPKSSNIGRPFFKYKKDINTYLYRSIDTNAGQLTLEENDTEDSGSMSLRGNKKDGELKVILEGATSEETATIIALTFTDGMITDSNDVTIPYVTPEPGTGLPDGVSPGDMLYWNGTDWIILPTIAAPGTEEINILTHSGTVPSWSAKTIITLSYCDAGSPTTGNFIKL